MPSLVNCMIRSSELPAGIVRKGISSSAKAIPTIHVPWRSESRPPATVRTSSTIRTTPIRTAGIAKSRPSTATSTFHETRLPQSSPEKPFSSPLRAASASVGENRRRATENRKM